MNPWPALVQFPGPSALPWAWRKHLRECYAPFCAAFLEPKPDPVSAIPCPRRCGCDHYVWPAEDDTFIARCHCDPPACESFVLPRPEVIPLVLSWSRLGRALCQALGLDPKPDPLNIYNTCQFGAWSVDAIPAILSIQVETFPFQYAVAELVAQLHRPFLLFAPTNEYIDAHIQSLLNNVGAAFFSLEPIVSLTPEGRLVPLQSPGQLFACFQPQPQDPPAEETARQVWALARQLDAGSGIRKASPLRVFLLYCKDGLSPDEIARQCHCSRPVVFARLKWLRARLGRNLEELRRYSEHFQRMEESLSDPRARRIYRKGAAYGEADEDET